MSAKTFFAKVVGLFGFDSLAANARSVADATGNSTAHCEFLGQTIDDPDQFLDGCQIVGNPAGGIGAVAFTKSPDCTGDSTYTSPPDGASIQWTGAPSTLKALMSNGGIDVSGNANKFSDHVALGRYGESSVAVPHCRILWTSNTSPNFPDVHAMTPFPDYPIPPPPVPAAPSGCNLLYAKYTITARARAAGVATLTTSTLHQLSVGNSVVVAGVQNQFNGTVVVTAVPSPTTFSYANTGATVTTTPSGGTATVGTLSVDSAWHSAHPTGGIYCVPQGQGSVTATITENNGNFNGYTFFAPSISVSSNGQTFTNAPPPAGQRPTVFDAYSGDFTMNGQSNTITGDIYAPFGNVSLSGGGVTTANGGSGFMESLKLLVSGNFATFNGTGPLIFDHCDFDPLLGITNPDQYLPNGCVIQGNRTESISIKNLSMDE
jgi:hypothetical protein